MNLPEKTLNDLFACWPVARFATLSGNAQPHIVPIVFCEYGGALFSPIDGKRKKGTPLQRTHNIATNPTSSLLLDHFESDWQRLWWVRIDCIADLWEPPEEDAQRIAERLINKYPQYLDPTLMFDRSAYLRLQPRKVTAWAQSGKQSSIQDTIASTAPR
ncbi:MAG: pyridoxamine 5'-phosphate oxidase family protein [Proteobacteria bacterium]|nr:pyridoxamine 5'-phosphate oxidase family protein [Pseudomonadota bacterium]